MKTIEKLNEETVRQISKLKNEPKWMTDFRLEAYTKFIELNNPKFGPSLDIDFDIITYYKKITEEVENNWNKVDKEVKDTFDDLGLIEAEHKYLDGVGAQFDSVAVYHNMIQELEEKNVIFCDTDTALKKYPEIFKEYFNKLIKYD